MNLAQFFIILFTDEFEPVPNKPIQHPPGSFVCENDVLPIICLPYEQIHIIDAIFGRQYPYNVCGGSIESESFELEFDCISPRSLPVTKELCEGLQTCHIPATIDTFGNPCRHAPKYLSVEYVCDIHGRYHDLSLVSLFSMRPMFILQLQTCNKRSFSIRRAARIQIITGS